MFMTKEYTVELDLNQKGYFSLESVHIESKRVLLLALLNTKQLLAKYHFGSRFSHIEAYWLCGAAQFWPDFCYHSDHDNYLAGIEIVSSFKNTGDLPKGFESWVNKNRREITKKAAQNLGIQWEEIEQLAIKNFGVNVENREKQDV